MLLNNMGNLDRKLDSDETFKKLQTLNKSQINADLELSEEEFLNEKDVKANIAKIKEN